MTRKDYILIAAALSAALVKCADNLEGNREAVGVYRCALSLAEALERDNARFDRARFLKACGVAS
jgi:hypothetical protein